MHDGDRKKPFSWLPCLGGERRRESRVRHASFLVLDDVSVSSFPSPASRLLLLLWSTRGLRNVPIYIQVSGTQLLHPLHQQ